MGWKLELVETGPASGARRMEVAWLGEVVAPASVDGIGLDHGMAQRMLGDIQRAVVPLQEVALQAEADRLRRLDPTLRLKDYRSRQRARPSDPHVWNSPRYFGEKWYGNPKLLTEASS